MNYFNIPFNFPALLPTAKLKLMLSDAVHEGFKQGFLGYDIDMEFVTLSLQVYASMIVFSVKDGANTVGKLYKNAVTKVSGKRQHGLECCLN